MNTHDKAAIERNCVGTAELRSDWDLETGTATVTVERADETIAVANHLLERPDLHCWDGTYLTLDTAGEYRYRFVRPLDENQGVFERVYQP